MRHCNMFHILHVGKNMVCIQYRMHCAGSKLFIYRSHFNKKNDFQKKKGRGHSWKTSIALPCSPQCHIIFPSSADCAIHLHGIVLFIVQDYSPAVMFDSSWIANIITSLRCGVESWLLKVWKTLCPHVEWTQQLHHSWCKMDGQLSPLRVQP